MFALSTNSTNFKILPNSKYKSCENTQAELKKNADEFLTDDEVMKISRRIIERNKQVYVELSK